MAEEEELGDVGDEGDETQKQDEELFILKGKGEGEDDGVGRCAFLWRPLKRCQSNVLGWESMELPHKRGSIFFFLEKYRESSPKRAQIFSK